MHNKTSYRLKFPEEIELESKEVELERLKGIHRALKETLSKLRIELRTFERVYHLVLGVRIAELDALESQIAGGAEESGASNEEPPAKEWSGHLHISELMDSDLEDDTAEDFAQKTLKSLYREVAKTIHPDLAVDEQDRRRREGLMSFANSAYSDENREALLKILREWEKSAENIRGKDIGAYLVKIIRLISSERESIRELESHIEALKGSDTYCFKQRVDAAMGNGIDLLAEMAATVDLNIANARKRLSAMKGGGSHPEKPHHHHGNRFIRFPSEASCGVLYTRSMDSINYCDWQKQGNAKGTRSIPLHMAVRLDVRGDLTPDLRFLRALQPEDLQSLFMYEVTDTAIEYIACLTGLEELYLSDSAISDEGLGRLSELSNLKRLYLYHIAISDIGLAQLHGLRKLSQLTCSGTMITDSGLTELQKAVPAVKTLSFPWRYGKK